MRTKNTNPLHPWRRARAIANPKRPVIEAKTLTELFSGPDRWAKGHAAVDRIGVSCWACSPAAYSWCLLGGVQKIYQQHYGDLMDALQNRIGGSVGYWNDHKASFTDIQALAAWTDAKAKELGLI